ncbi:hypothetical protein D3C79_955870 [compost metagenome]
MPGEATLRAWRAMASVIDTVVLTFTTKILIAVFLVQNSVLGAVDGKVLAGTVHVVFVAIGDQVVHAAGDGGAEEPGERRQGTEGRHQ